MSTVMPAGEACPCSAGTELVAVDFAGEADIALLVSWVAAGALGAPPPPGVPLGVPMGACVRLGLARGSAAGEPLGFVRLDLGPGQAEVSLYVVPAARRMGVGRRLVAWAAEQAGARGLYALVERGNLAAEALFGALSFQDEGPGPGSRERWALHSGALPPGRGEP